MRLRIHPRWVNLLLVVVAAVLSVLYSIQIGQISRLANDNRRDERALTGLVCGLALNQPNLDPRLLVVLTQVLDQVNGKCAP